MSDDWQPLRFTETVLFEAREDGLWLWTREDGWVNTGPNPPGTDVRLRYNADTGLFEDADKTR